MRDKMVFLLFLACTAFAADPFSRSTPAEVVVTHMKLDLQVGFSPRKLAGRVDLKLSRSTPGQRQELVLDTKDLQIVRVAGAEADGRFAPLAFSLEPADPVLGSALRVALPPGVQTVRVDYQAGRDADALQWLDGPQTRNGRPFLYTQSGTIHARSWIPIQDSPAVRFTWEATVHAPPGLVAVMSATRVPAPGAVGRFRMSNPVPAYLIALAVGDLAFRAWNPRMGVFAERPVVSAAHREFRDAPRMIEATERLFGPYRWDRFDLLIMPPAFPYSGVENAQLTFVSPTLVVGDRSQVSIIAHELAHAWAGNLVTQETWNDVWLNEGLTVYLERRIVDELYGSERAAAEAELGRHRLLEELAALPPADQRLRVDFTGRDPDQVLSSVPYEKGYLFFLQLERDFGRQRLDAFLRRMFQDRAFQSLNTGQFLARLRESLPTSVESWIDEPGLPANAPLPSARGLEEAGRVAAAWAAEPTPGSGLPARTWTAEQWAWFLTSLPRTIPPSRVAALDNAWHLSQSPNPAILVPWLRIGIRSGYGPALAQAESVLRSVGRGSIVMPLFEELLALPGWPARAARIYREARSSYHPVIAAALDRRIHPDPAR